MITYIEENNLQKAKELKKLQDELDALTKS